MRWNKFRLKTLTAAEEIVISLLEDIGINGVQIEDHVPLSRQELDQMFVDIMPDGPEDDGTAYLSFYLDESEDYEPILAKIREELDSLRTFTDIGDGSIEISRTEDVDWINNWKQYFHQFYVDDILITPSWEEVKPEDSGRMILHIDPGTAFGTGLHETTQLCIRGIRRYLRPGMKMLDIGTGSGILSITALLMGAEHVVGTDLDPGTEIAVPENLEANHLGKDKMELFIGNLAADPDLRNTVGYECYDLVTANILAEVLVSLMEPAAKAMKHGGVLITSGILEGKESIVAETMGLAGLELIQEDRQGEWCCLIARKN